MKKRLIALLSTSAALPGATLWAQEAAPAEPASASVSVAVSAPAPDMPPAEPVAPAVADAAAPAVVESAPAAPMAPAAPDAYGVAPAEPQAEPAPGPEFLPLKVGGSFWSRYELRRNYAEHGLRHPRLHRDGDYIVTRARLSLATNPVDVGDGTMVSATFVPQAAYTMQNTGTLAPPPTVTIGDAPPVAVYEAFARVGTKKYQFDMGRFAMDYGDAMIIGNLGWNEAARAFQGARLHLTPMENAVFVDAFVTLLNEGFTATHKPFAGDTYFYGAYAGLGALVNESMALDFYLLGRSFVSAKDLGDDENGDPIPDVDGDTFFTLGARAKDSIDTFDYRAEAGIQFGSDRFAYQADAELGLTPAQGFRIGLGGLVASGDDDAADGKTKAWDQLYPTAHKFLGLADVAGARTNKGSGNLNLSYAVTPAWVLKAQGHIFAAMEPAGDSDAYQGAEIDAHIVHPIGKGALVRAMYGAFLPNEDFAWAGGDADKLDQPIHYLEVQFGYDFK